MAVGDIISIPNTTFGITCTKTNVAWAINPIPSTIAFPTTDYYALIGYSFQVEQIPTADVTVELIIRTLINSVAVVDIPYSFRMDTTVGYYFSQPHTIFLPEPKYIASGSDFRVIMTDNQAIATAYTQVKAIVMIVNAPVVPFDPVDPFGMMGIFGI